MELENPSVLVPVPLSASANQSSVDLSLEATDNSESKESDMPIPEEKQNELPPLTTANVKSNPDPDWNSSEPALDTTGSQGKTADQEANKPPLLSISELSCDTPHKKPEPDAALSNDKEEISNEKEEISNDKEEISNDKEEISNEKEEISNDKEEISNDKKEISNDKEEILKEGEPSTLLDSETIDTANTLSDLKDELTGSNHKLDEDK
ncbi:hypothetical protein BB560_002440 [Smittium megazygosporum]|uniref:Uncharacterized protein n=1 Tax=Smittium megazygosporum TaxID=133381 RepID=A0A2T9ZET3_9FUNG|nr:hypothetical protein BB560_002440 [Smittium megazygosporum]